MANSQQIQRIQERAYAIWERAGRPQGADREHWLQAEAEITAAAPGANGGGRRSPAAAKRTPSKPARTTLAAKPATSRRPKKP